MLVASVVFALAAPTAIAATNPGATDAVAAAVQARLGPPTNLFVNCPTENTIPQPDGSADQGCEWRALLGSNITTGYASARVVGTSWQVVDFLANPPVPNTQQRCANRVLGSKKVAGVTRSVIVHGLACSYMDLLGVDARGAVSLKRLRIKPRFIAGGRGTNTVGFVIFLFACEGKNLGRKGGEPPSRLFFASCSNPFGDSFAYRFILSAPEPPRKKKETGDGGGGGGGSGRCEPGYSPCLPVVGDLDCDDIPDSKKPVRVSGSDRYRLDADGDGIGCES